MGAFSGLASATRGFSSNPLQPGKYVVRIDECAFFETEQAGEMWKNTLTILAVEDGSHRVGEVVHTFFRTKAGKKTFQSNLKAFLAGVLDVPDDSIGEEQAAEACGPKSPMKGLVTVVAAHRRTSKDKKDEKTGEPITYVVYQWTPCLDDATILQMIGEEAYAQFFPSEG